MFADSFIILVHPCITIMMFILTKVTLSITIFHFFFNYFSQHDHWSYDSAMKLAEKLRRLRAGQSYAEIAAATNCSAGNIRKIEAEASSPGFGLGIALAKYFRVPAEWLGDDNADWPPPPVTRRDQLIEVVERTLRPLVGIEDFYPEEQPVIARLRNVDWTARPPIMKAIAAILDIYDDAVEFGVEAGRISEGPDEFDSPPPDPAAPETEVGERLDRDRGPRKKKSG